MRSQWKVAVAVIWFAIASSSCVQQQETRSTQAGPESERSQSPHYLRPTAPSDFLKSFFKIYAVTQAPLLRDELEIRCQKKVGPAFVTFVGVKQAGILLVVFSQEKFTEPGRNIRTSTPKGGLPPGATRDWGYVFDRNGDGRVDYLAYHDGPSPVVPDDWEGELPNLKNPISKKVLKEVIIPNIRLLFWHLADDDYDGQHDGAATSTRNLRSGWIDGWVVMRDKDFDGSYDSCKAFEGQLRSELGLCSGDATGYSVSGKEPSGLGKIPPPRNIPFLEWANEVAHECQLENFQKGWE